MWGGQIDIWTYEFIFYNTNLLFTSYKKYLIIKNYFITIKKSGVLRPTNGDNFKKI